MKPRFTVIIPAYNAADTIAASIRSVLTQDGLGDGDVEVIAVDDGSTDDTAARISELAAEHAGLHAAATSANTGPGAARNEGIALARGEWLLFLDSDDRLAPGALCRLAAYLDGFAADNQPQAIGFDWCFATPAGMPLTTGRRRDQAPLTGARQDLLRRYLRLQMDGSVIYTALRRELVVTHGLRFADGYHEDVAFIFKAYQSAERIAYLDQILYLKSERPGSIVNTISLRHIEGFLGAWADIAGFLSATAPEEWDALRPDWQRGLTGVIATRLREIARRAVSPSAAASLYRPLFSGLAALPAPPRWAGARAASQYEQLAERFLALFGNPQVDDTAAAEQLTRFVRETAAKTWSCTDLHHSAFLAPNQVRTCCKRFFVEGKMRGDVVLLDTPSEIIGADSILAAKRDLHARINRGDETPCDGCPFMEFKDWGAIERLDIRYLSMEYHSVCNLKCTYCSDTYYGGSPPQYDVEALVDELLAAGALDACHTVVWGGGEPVVDKNFAPLIEKLVERLPNAAQRVLTNAVKHSKTVEKLLATGSATVTTSIDAGTADTFARVRGKAKLRNVLATLARYAAASSERVTVKYIFTAQNHSLDEIRDFADLIADHRLTACNFQISSDFKEEAVSPTGALSMIVLYGLLSRAGVQVIFFDDLLRYRLSDILADHEVALRSRLAALGLADTLADPADYPTVVIWGAGWQSRQLLEHASFFKRTSVAFFVDQTAAKIGSTYFGRPVKSPETLQATDEPIIIAAAQGYPAIYRNFLALGLPPERLVRQLIL
ncbi:glycosyltransferase [Azospira restricta]|uniref:Glycosyltransferase n=1 Tax=Azospira restricta TaxID=404405 RepID=A0A974Y5K8_9RHOO|nr:glycosyltransferase [Azospira restricta]QRJ65490.1 glycosyltransferase [Azospira restricta]